LFWFDWFSIGLLVSVIYCGSTLSINFDKFSISFPLLSVYGFIIVLSFDIMYLLFLEG